MSTSVNALTPAPIAVEERVLEDLRSRLRATIWPEDDGNEDGRYGVPRALLQELAQYWAEKYDWRAERSGRVRPRCSAAACGQQARAGE